MTDQKQAIEQAKEVYDQLGCDPQEVFTILAIAKFVGTDPQKAHALIAIAKIFNQFSTRPPYRNPV